MKKTKTTRKLLLALLLLAFGTQMKAQSNANIGLYFGYRGGLAYIIPTSTDKAFELLVTFEHSGVGIAANKLYTHQFLSSEPQLKLMYGFGIFTRLSSDARYVFDYDGVYWDNRFWGIGANGILGLDYAFTNNKLHLGLTLRPAIEFGIGDYRHWPGTGYLYLTFPISELKF